MQARMMTQYNHVPGGPVTCRNQRHFTTNEVVDSIVSLQTGGISASAEIQKREQKEEQS
jgi:hypothetical protein